MCVFCEEIREKLQKAIPPDDIYMLAAHLFLDYRIFMNNVAERLKGDKEFYERNQLCINNLQYLIECLVEGKNVQFETASEG